MYRHLAVELTRYCTADNSGQRIFCNGMNQNALVEAMAVQGRMEFEAAQLSRAISGQRLLSDNQLYVFSQVLGLSGEDRWRLDYAAARDLCQRKGLEIDLATAPPVVNVLIRNAARISEAIDEGAVALAIDLLADLYAARAALDDPAYSAPPMLRILSLAEIDRGRILAKLETREGSADDVLLENVEVVGMRGFLRLADSVPATELERGYWRKYYVDGLDVDEIAGQDGLTVETVYAVLESWKGRLLQHLAEDPSEQLDG